MADELRLPPAHKQIEFHFCRNIHCRNYAQYPQETEKWSHATGMGAYRLSGGKSSAVVLICKLCNRSFPVKSNVALSEEVERCWRPFTNLKLTCPNAACERTVPRSSRKRVLFAAFGSTKSGQPRYKCNSCGTTFSRTGRIPRKLQREGLDSQIATLLVNKMPMRRICETAEVSPSVLYNQITRCHDLAEAFAARAEEDLIKTLHLRRVYLAVDRQDHVFNWGSSFDRRNALLQVVASADNATGYVFATHMNFDADMEPELIERDAVLSGDYEKPYHFRKYARVWLQREYNDDYHTLTREKKRVKGQSLKNEIIDGYTGDGEEKPDNEDIKLPSQGMQVHSEYTLYAHFWFLAKLLERVEKVRIFMDQDTGMRNACLGAFSSRVKDETIEAFFVKINKDLTTTQKKTMKSGAEHTLRQKQEELGIKDRKEAIQAVMVDRLESMMKAGDEGDQWLFHPFPDMSEPEKAVCHLTNYGDYDIGHLAALYRKASLHSIDKFFMQVRRRVSLLERPRISASAMRTWHGYSAYNPAVAQKVINLFRIVHNFVLIGEDKKTPAMRIGLADKPYKMEDLLRITHEH